MFPCHPWSHPKILGLPGTSAAAQHGTDLPRARGNGKRREAAFVVGRFLGHLSHLSQISQFRLWVISPVISEHK